MAGRGRHGAATVPVAAPAVSITSARCRARAAFEMAAACYLWVCGREAETKPLSLTCTTVHFILICAMLGYNWGRRTGATMGHAMGATYVGLVQIEILYLVRYYNSVTCTKTWHHELWQPYADDSLQRSPLARASSWALRWSAATAVSSTAQMAKSCIACTTRPPSRNRVSTQRPEPLSTPVPRKRRCSGLLVPARAQPQAQQEVHCC